MKMNKYIDHTFLKPEATTKVISKLCEDARHYDFKSVCVNPYWITHCKKQLQDSDVLVCTVIGFPLGANTLESKVNETRDAVNRGADELDMVINIGALKEGNYDYLVKEITAVVAAAESRVVKVIIEACLLSEEEKIMACQAVLAAKADFVKTSTGFSSGGATVEDVRLLKSIVGDKAKVKAAGGVRSLADMEEMIAAGAERIGTSNGVEIINATTANAEY